jgi:hypothetical protein
MLKQVWDRQSDKGYKSNNLTSRGKYKPGKLANTNLWIFYRWDQVVRRTKHPLS